MPIGFTLIVSTTAYNSAPFARAGQTANFTVACLNNEGVAELDIIIEHKNAEDTSWTTAGSFAQITATVTTVVTVTPLKQMLRYKYTVSGDTGDFVHIYMYPPAWQD